MTGEIQITLKELTQIALGSPEVNEVNVAVLHSLFDIILKKMNCEHETVSFEGMEGSCLQKLLEKSRISSFYFNTDEIESLSDKMQRLEELEKRTKLVENKLLNHFDRIRRCHANHRIAFLAKDFPHYSHFCEDLLFYDGKLRDEIIGNEQFIVKLIHILSAPFVRHMLELEQKVENLRTKFNKFVSRARKKYEKIIVAEDCVFQVEALKTAFKNIELKFNNTMDELQSMLDAKLCKDHLPPLRKYIKNILSDLEESLDSLKFSSDCKVIKAADTKTQCISCGDCYVCDSNVPVKSHHNYMECEVAPKAVSICSKKTQMSCGHEQIEKKIPLQTRIKNLDYNNLRDALGLPNVANGKRRSLKLPSYINKTVT